VDTVEAEALEGLVRLQANGVRAGPQSVPNGCTVKGPHLVSARVENGLARTVKTGQNGKIRVKMVENGLSLWSGTPRNLNIGREEGGLW
jgi:hypothetical protein